MYKFIHLEQGSEAWKEYRRSKIGASEVAAIQGICPYSSSLMLYNSKIDKTERSVNSGMEQGTRLEPIIRDRVNYLHNTNFQPVVMESTINDFMFCSLDGWDFTADVKQIEIKVNNAERHQMACENQVFEPHMIQVQTQLAVSGLSEELYVSYHAASDHYAFVEVERNPQQIKGIVEDCRKFFYEHMIAFLPPDASEMDYVDITNGETLEWAKEYIEIDTNIKLLEIMKETFRDRLIETAKEKNARIGNMKMTKFTRKGNVDYSKIPELKNVPLDDYRKAPTTQWRIS